MVRTLREAAEALQVRLDRARSIEETREDIVALRENLEAQGSRLNGLKAQIDAEFGRFQRDERLLQSAIEDVISQRRRLEQ